MSEPFKLFRLQQIDTQLDRALGRIKEIDSILLSNAELQAAQTMVTAAEETLLVARKKLRFAEAEVRSQQIKIEQSESALYSGKIRNPKELQDLQQELASLKRYLIVLEDRQLEAMIVQEDAEEERQTHTRHLTAVKEKTLSQTKTLNTEKDQLVSEVERLEGERSAAISSISPEALNLYTELRKRRRGVAVALVAEKTCSACGSILAAALLQASRSPTSLHFCDTCGRILYRG